MKPKHKRGVEIYSVWEADKKVWRYRVRARNGKIIGPTESFSSRKNVIIDIEALFNELILRSLAEKRG